jgi:hypothetical protein
VPGNITRSIILSALAAILPAPANDTAATLGAGGLVPIKSSMIVMESEDLEISPHRITVRYLFRNTSRRDVFALIAFPLPEINGGDVANIPIALPSRDPLNFVDFQVLVGGRRITPDVEVRAFFDQTEITSRLRSLRLPLSVLYPTVTAAVARLAAGDRSKLQQDGWIDCSLTNNGKCWPYWRSRIQYYWTERFPAGSAIEVRHEYRPVVGGSHIYESSGAGRSVKPFCAVPDALDRIRNMQQSHRGTGEGRPVLVERRIDYILVTANNWGSPIGNFRLSVEAESPDDLVLTCMPGLSRVSPTRYELARRNFRPAVNLHLLVLQKFSP